MLVESESGLVVGALFEDFVEGGGLYFEPIFEFRVLILGDFGLVFLVFDLENRLLVDTLQEQFFFLLA